MKINWKLSGALLLLLTIGLGVVGSTRDAAVAETNGGTGLVFDISEPVIAGSSLPVTELPSGSPPVLYKEINPLRNPSQFEEGMGIKGSNTQIMDALAANGRNPDGETPGLLFSFEGLGTDGFAPPDTVGDVGPNHYIQMVNISFRVFDKSGNPLTADTPFNALFAGYGGVCENDNDGDPIVLYDPLADRWIMSQFALSGPLTQCIAVSKTADPTGAYWLYGFPMPAFPDYPKFGVWPDAYYLGTNTGSPNQYYAHALDRNNMLNGAPATRQSFGGFPSFLMPADIDGPTPPAVNDPGIFYTFLKNGYPNHPPGVDRIEVYEFDVDWVTPGNSTFGIADTIPISAYNYTVCGFFIQNCIPQPGTGQKIDSLSYWPMFRLAYRNLTNHESLVGNFTVDLDGSDKAAIRWFELRNSPSGWSLFQEGTYAPDGDHRFMGSIAMDGSGNIALGYSVSSATTKPAIRYATRLYGDPLGTLSAEASLIEGGGVQTSIVRWGDYAAMSVDPADECTFWLTSEYHDVNDGGFNWNTRVGVFKEPTCTGALGPDFTLQITPPSQEVCAPSDAVFNVTIGSVEGFSDPVTLSALGNPAGTTAGFDNNPVVPPDTSVLTIGNTSGGTAGSYAIDIVGVAPTSTHTSTVTLDLYTANPGVPSLTAPANGASNVSLAPTFEWSGSTQAATYDLDVATDPGFSSIVYSATGITGEMHTAMSPLDPLSHYYWRVRGANVCGDGGYSTTFEFDTADIPPILLVDDDDDNPDVRTYWTDTLDALGLSYDIWETGGSDVEPNAGEIAPYSIVLWFTGDRFGSQGSGPAGPSAATETALASWLDGGGCFFVSSQDYHYDKGTTSLMTGYLGVITLADDTGNYTSVTGQNVFSGLGPYTLTFPYTDFTDPMTVGNGGVQAMLGNNSNVAGTSKETADYKTSFWAFGLETLPVAGREATLGAFVSWCGVQAEVPEIVVDPTSIASTQETGTITNQDLTIENVGTAVLDWTIDEDTPATPLVDWSDNFDTYGTGVSLHGLGGWKGWNNDPNFTAFTSSVQDRSAPNSVDINGNADLVHEYAGYTSGKWIYTAWQYIPGGFSGETYFIMLNRYDDSQITTNWSTQVKFSSSTGQVINDGGASGGVLNYKTDQWIEIRVEIDLDLDTQSFYYDDQLLYSGSWTQEVSGGGALAIAAVDLFGNGASPVYYDDLSLVEVDPPPPAACSSPEDVPWLSVNPTNGSTNPAASSIIDVEIDATGLVPGDYSALLCIASNDPGNNLVVVPVDLELIEVISYDLYLPITVHSP